MELSDNLDTDIKEVDISTTVIKEDTVMAFAMSFEPGKYKKYGPENIKRFIMLQEENPDSVPKCAKACMIPRSTAYELRDL
jgi:hypothetical protein